MIDALLGPLSRMLCLLAACAWLPLIGIAYAGQMMRRRKREKDEEA